MSIFQNIYLYFEFNCTILVYIIPNIYCDALICACGHFRDNGDWCVPSFVYACMATSQAAQFLQYIGGVNGTLLLK